MRAKVFYTPIFAFTKTTHMKRTVLTSGVISGLIVSALMIISSVMCYNNHNMELGMVLGYSSMLIAFSLIFVGIKNYRDKYNDGTIRFGKAFVIGLYIALIASTFYVATWLVEYYFFMPDFAEKYCTHVVEKARASGASEIEIKKQMLEMDQFKTMYKNPLFVILMTYVEILPVGIVVSLIAALILKRKTKV